MTLDPSRTVRDPGSFRDPSGQIFHRNGRIFRSVSPAAAEDFAALRDSGLLAELTAHGLLIESEEADRALLGDQAGQAALLLEHPRLSFVSYPYEWPFALLQQAALLHLDLQLRALERNFALSDATAYNVQFRAGRPVFIDLLSLRPYREGEFWAGYKQFCEQFVNPLALRSKLGVPHNDWYRGSLEGLTARDLAPLLKLRHKLSFNVFSHIVLQARVGAASDREDTAKLQALRDKGLSKTRYRALLQALRSWIAGLKARPVAPGAARPQILEAESAVRAFAAEVNPNQLWALGCGDGALATAALDAGAGEVIGFEADPDLLEAAAARGHGRALLPLYLPPANPSPGQGWNGAERKSLAARRSADALLALGAVQELAIGHNIPLAEAVAWLIGLAPRGLVDFAGKEDSEVRRRLLLREDIFPDYQEARFRDLLSQAAEIEAEETLPSGRTLFRYRRKPAAEKE
ncbi:MAG: class I SAM-dependent methyltransferase [Rhodovibrionaceae bacterium]